MAPRAWDRCGRRCRRAANQLATEVVKTTVPLLRRWDRAVGERARAPSWLPEANGQHARGGAQLPAGSAALRSRTQHAARRRHSANLEVAGVEALALDLEHRSCSGVEAAIVLSVTKAPGSRRTPRRSHRGGVAAQSRRAGSARSRGRWCASRPTSTTAPFTRLSCRAYRGGWGSAGRRPVTVQRARRGVVRLVGLDHGC